MKLSTTFQALALTLSLGCSVAATAGDFDEGYPLFPAKAVALDSKAAKPAPAQAQREPGRPTVAEASAAGDRRDSLAARLAQHPAQPRSSEATAVRAEAR